MGGDVEILCVQTEEKGDLTLLSKGNALRSMSKKKKKRMFMW